MPTTTATELAQLGGLVTTDSSTSTVTVNGTLTATTITLPNNSVTAAKLANPQYTGFRNRIINGDMRIDQRSSGSAYAITSSLYGSCDRWGSLTGANGVWSQQRVTTGSTDFPFAMRVQRTAGSTSTAAVYIGQIIETTNCADLAGKSVTLSFDAIAGANFSSSGSVITCQVFTGTGSDQGWTSLNSASWSGFAASISASQAITTTKTRYSFTGSIPAGTNEIAVRFDVAGTGTAGANDWFQITGIQLEAGSTATDFERRPIGTELALCQRYCYKVTSVSAGDPYLRYAVGECVNTQVIEAVIPLPVQMRITPSLTTPAASQFAAYTASTIIQATVVNLLLGSGVNNVGITTAVASGLTIGRAAQILSNNNHTSYLLFSSEL